MVKMGEHGLDFFKIESSSLSVFKEDYIHRSNLLLSHDRFQKA